jgi:hypothetical protein
MGYYYTKQGYAMVADNSSSTHHFGGENHHAGATCPVCKIPLLLLADLDCVSLRSMEKEKLFCELDRLPLYYCWRCCAEKLSYKVVNHSTIKVFKNDGKPQGADFPYVGFPEKFEERPVRLIPVPYETAKLAALAQEVGTSWLTDQDRQAIQNGLQGLRHRWFSNSSLGRHQIGGLLNLAQGHDYLVCPNPDCKAHQAAKKFSGCRMMELAVIHNDPHSGLPMLEKLEDLSEPSQFDEFIQVVYWVCEECLTITTSNRCD